MVKTSVQKAIGRLKAGKKDSPYLEDIVKPCPNVLKAFNRLGVIANCYQEEKEAMKIAKLDEEAKEKISGYDRHTLSFLCITKYFFNKYFNSDNEEDSICVTNPSIDIYEKEGPINIFKDPEPFVKMRLDGIRNHEGIGVLELDSYDITNNGLYIPSVSQIKLKKEFGIKDDIELIHKIGYPTDYQLDQWPQNINPPEIGTKNKAMLSYSINHPGVSFIVLNKYGYIIQGGKIINKKSPSYFKELC